MNSKTKSRVIAILRRASMMHPPISKECKNRARVGRGLYKCEKCGEISKLKNQATGDKMQVDHINPVIPLDGWEGFDSFIENLFCDVDNLQLLCNKCHKEKTQKENEIRRKNKASKSDTSSGRDSKGSNKTSKKKKGGGRKSVQKA